MVYHVIVLSYSMTRFIARASKPPPCPPAGGMERRSAERPAPDLLKSRLLLFCLRRVVLDCCPVCMCLFLFDRPTETCIYIYIYIYIYTHTYACTHMCIYIYIYIHTI